MPNPSGIDYVYFQPRKLIDFTERYIFVIDVLDYKIKIYTFKGICVDSITNSFKGQTFILPKKTDFSKEDPYDFGLANNRVRNYVDIYRKNLFNSKIMSSINVMNDMTLQICWTSPNREKTNYGYYYDVWRLNSSNSKWV